MSAVDSSEYVVRYASGGNISGTTVNGGAFVIKEKDAGQLSLQRPAVFATTTVQAMPDIRRVSRLQLRRTGRFAEFQLEASFKALIDVVEVAALEDALEADGDYPEDPSHAVMVGLPVDDSPMAEMCGDLIAGTVIELHLAVADA